jgi:hypothetical protein
MANRFAQLSAIMAVMTLTAAGGAAVVNIDIQPEGFPGWDPYGPQQTYTGLGAAPDAGTFWNVFEMDNKGNTSESETGFLTSDGVTVTTVGLTVGGNVGSFANQSHTNAAVPLMRDEAFKFDQTGAFWITGLIADESYDVYVYMAGRNVGDTSSVYIEEDTDTLVTTSAADDTTTNLIEGEDYYIFGNITPGADEQIRLDWIGGIQGFQVVGNFIPEPASLALLGIGGLALIRRRR